MSNTPPDIADDNRNNCPVTINYVNKYIVVWKIVNFRFVGKLIKNTKYKKLLICINKCIYVFEKSRYKINF
jgi:hypothetical protein